MKFVAAALILMMTSNEHGGYRLDRHLDEDGKQVVYPGSTVNNHHYIPRPDFNSKGGGDNDNGVR
ncbi:unnamed protein product [Malus baccata var. baccata]|uniref:Uncharacterized protein n=1 Tax=Malus domestica TaxID=3750 RepID=A0A498K8M3_MALDO|nr:hypothetical protein DVH24_038894 [Malus domestica]